MSILYGLVSVEDVMKPQKAVAAPRFRQAWIHRTKTVYTNHPGLVAPISTVFFWVHRLGLDAKQLVISNKVGYCSVEHLQAELRGFYSFYMDQCRSVFDSFYIYF